MAVAWLLGSSGAFRSDSACLLSENAFGYMLYVPAIKDSQSSKTNGMDVFIRGTLILILKRARVKGLKRQGAKGRKDQKNRTRFYSITPWTKWKSKAENN
ncbi:predicted protein [Coccidioides posadasii str. Silveira]|uniref:Predicted protein n=2 Tax=Coccidioides posadasii TaxID=199306 RepID=E9D477_COCPS|nr:predicted protein [Coccidioides posadasii str. Silveira]KMM71215.1 hypothetical protein CPAG_07522 [Coccidioides posadasii RMSCC 3488]